MSRTHPVSLVVTSTSIQLLTLFRTTFHQYMSHFAPLSAPLQLCNTWLERKLIEQKCVTKVRVSVTCSGGLTRASRLAARATVVSGSALHVP
jgi:hypothetical protein